jgi:putative peptidoglycan lipid II flippase
VQGFWTTSLGTLASRTLGLVRDMVTAALLGLGQGGVMDALVVALRLPNLSRRVLGEGALATSLLPVFTAEHQRNPAGAWRLLSVLLSLLATVLAALVAFGELACLAWWWLAGGEQGLLIGLTAVLLPYLFFICLAAQAAAALQGLSQFRWPAIAPVLLNVCWLAAIWLVAPTWQGDRAAQAVVIAIAVVISGVLQLAVLLPPLYRSGFRFEFDVRAAAPAVRQVLRATLPIAFGLAVTQINTLVDSFLAVALAAELGSRETIAWLGHSVAYPLETGAAAAIYYGERFYQLPVGVLGIAIATVIYPLLARHAARGDRQQLGADLTAGLGLVWFLALPAGVGLMLLARPLMQLLFVRGAFTAHDAQRAAAMIACYASAAWAYCALPMLARGFYSVGDRITPVRVGMIAVGVDLLTTLLLVRPLAERGLAVSTAVAASVQVVLLTVLFSRRCCPLLWPQLRVSLTKGGLATLVMTLAVMLCCRLLPASVEASRWEQGLQLSVAIATGVVAYLAAAWMLGMPELAIFGRGRKEEHGWSSHLMETGGQKRVQGSKPPRGTRTLNAATR